ncbi:hypothetical protein BJ875DRAFT_99803 [Amylocarpus encephaloides]|uniref:Uncharacterized protein n=1 Tax=Amylocarpus encephaloides TaxID=45428 RepID=A0A9P7YF69_9HELO|nr:hypothetical protein BJ875DRAFT_99803 [Amylocarpus encephaloides]
MASQNLPPAAHTPRGSRSVLLALPPPPSSPSEGKKKSAESKRKLRQTTVYDAVAGRISTDGFIPKQAVFRPTRDTRSSSAVASAPEAILFRRKHAPTRFAEHDIYFASERDARAIDVPESDLLKALHVYTSDFYSRATTDGGTVDWRSMDETAMIALGILMEEICCPGQSSDLALTEAQISNDDLLGLDDSARLDRPKTQPSESNKRRLAKRRRIDTHSVIEGDE